MGQEETKYDFTVIGSGISGLVSALVLAKNGYRVRVLEKNHQVGGALQVFSRDKRIFDTGVHYIGGLDKGENLHQIFAYLGILDQLKWQRLDDACFDLIRLNDGTCVAHAQGYDGFKASLGKAFPNEGVAIEAFCSKIQEVCSYFPLYNLESEAEKTYYTHPEILAESAWEYVGSITKNEQLRSVLLGSGILYAGDAKTTPLYVVALIMNSFIKGSYRLVDGGSQLAKALVGRIREFGGEVLKRKEVCGARWNADGSIASLVCLDGSEYASHRVISTLHPVKTIHMLGKEHFVPANVRRIERLKNTVSTFLVNIVLKEEAIPYINHNFYDFFTDDTWDTVDYQQENWPQVLFTCTAATSKSMPYADSLSVMAYMSKEETEKWAGTHNTVAKQQCRGEEYEAFKREKEERVIARLEERFPDIRDHILAVYSSTPLTYRDYLGTPEGELYGIEKNYHNPAGTLINPRTRIPNLFLSGQNIVFHGILGATIGALVTSFNFVDSKRIIHEIKHYD